MAAKIARAFRIWLPLAVAVSALALLINLAVQQNFRMSANDPQIQLAEDIANSLPHTVRGTGFISGPVVDIARSLAPWVAIYDDSAHPIASSGRLDGAAPSLPDGVFAYARSHGENRLTWQPRRGVRSAIVVIGETSRRPFFVVAGRSLREIEARVEALNFISAIACAATLNVLLIVALLAASAPAHNGGTSECNP